MLILADNKLNFSSEKFKKFKLYTLKSSIHVTAHTSSRPGSRAGHRGPTVAGHQHQACCQVNSSRADQEDPHQKRQQPGL